MKLKIDRRPDPSKNVRRFFPLIPILWGSLSYQQDEFLRFSDRSMYLPMARNDVSISYKAASTALSLFPYYIFVLIFQMRFRFRQWLHAVGFSRTTSRS